MMIATDSEFAAATFSWPFFLFRQLRSRAAFGAGA